MGTVQRQILFFQQLVPFHCRYRPAIACDQPGEALPGGIDKTLPPDRIGRIPLQGEALTAEIAFRIGQAQKLIIEVADQRGKALIGPTRAKGVGEQQKVRVRLFVGLLQYQLQLP